MINKMIIKNIIETLMLLLAGFSIGWAVTSHLYEQKYVALRGEIIHATEPIVDISYPYRDDPNRLNESWFRGWR